MERAVAKVSPHIKCGASNAMYIGSLREEPTRDAERDGRLVEMTEGAATRVVEDDSVWGWNVPWFVADDGYGIWETKEGRALLEDRSLTLSARHMGLGPAPRSAERLSVEEKRENLVAHFSALADLEERRGGLSHFRIIVTVGRDISISELKEMVNTFVRENFPLCPAFAAIHDDTEHRHAHIYVHARQLDDRKIDLRQDYFRLDEGWMRVCAEHLGIPEIYTRHIELKEETRGWNDRAEKAAKAEKPLPPKPDRWGDHHDTLLIFRPFNDRWCGRLMAQTRVAETKAAWLEATQARAEEIAAAREVAGWLRDRLDAAAVRRAKSKSESKRGMPAEVITIEEQQEQKDYERDILSAEKPKAKGTRGTSATTSAATQTSLPFDGTTHSPVEQLGFDFGAQIVEQGGDRVTAQSRPAHTGQKSQAHKRAKAETVAAIPSASPSIEETARILGHELVAETKLAFYESASGAARTRKEKQQLKGQLATAREENDQAYCEAEVCRAHLATQGAAEPPYLLTEDERNYLKLVSRHLPELLRERIKREISRARMIPDRSEDLPTQSGKEPISRADIHRHDEVEEKQSPAVVGGRSHPVADDRQREVPTRQSVEKQGTTMTTKRPPGSAIRALPDEEARRMIADCELAKARALALRAAEEDFNAAPHRWVSPTHKVTLAAMEAQIGDGLKRGQDVRGLEDLKRRVQDQIAAERVSIPLRRKEAEDEARSLKERVAAEAAARVRLRLKMPDAMMTPDELREMVGCAEALRDPKLLRTAYEIELGQALRDARLTGDGSHVRRLEEKYAGVGLKAEVSADRAKQFLGAASKIPDKILLPALDEAGRDIALTLDQASPRGVIRGVIGKLVETAAHRRFREQLTETREAYFRHLRSDVACREAFCESVGSIRLECRERGREFGYHAPARPELTRGEIQEIRDYAVKQAGGSRERWLSACTAAQRLADERDSAAWKPTRTVEILSPSQASQERSDQIRKEIEKKRAEANALQRVSRTGVERDQQDAHKPHERDSREPGRSGGSRSRGR
jgi:hypothetical protein